MLFYSGCSDGAVGSLLCRHPCDIFKSTIADVGRIFQPHIVSTHFCIFVHCNQFKLERINTGHSYLIRSIYEILFSCFYIYMSNAIEHYRNNIQMPIFPNSLGISLPLTTSSYFLVVITLILSFLIVSLMSVHGRD